MLHLKGWFTPLSHLKGCFTSSWAIWASLMPTENIPCNEDYTFVMTGLLLWVPLSLLFEMALFNTSINVLFLFNTYMKYESILIGWWRWPQSSHQLNELKLKIFSLHMNLFSFFLLWTMPFSVNSVHDDPSNLKERKIWQLLKGKWPDPAVGLTVLSPHKL